MLVQHTHDFDQLRRNDAVVDDVYGGIHDLRREVTSCVAHMKAANASRQLRTIARQQALRFSGDHTQRGCEKRSVAAAAICPPALGARLEDPRQIRLGRQRKAKTRHASSADVLACRAHVLEISIELHLVDLEEIAALQRLDTCSDLRS